MRRGKGELREFFFDWSFLLGVYIIIHKGTREFDTIYLSLFRLR